MTVPADQAPRRRNASGRTGTSSSAACLPAANWRRYVPMSSGSSRSSHPTTAGIRLSSRLPSATRCSTGAAASQQAIGHPRILEVVEYLLGEDCHVIANTAWWQQPGENDHLGRFWHIDAGPHVPRDPGIPWDPRIPYPVFTIATHLYLQDCPIESGPTGVIPGSHAVGPVPTMEATGRRDPRVGRPWRCADRGRGRGRRALRLGRVAQASPPWPNDPGRMFVQCHYGRRDLAQRIRPTAEVNHVSAEAAARAQTPRERTLIGLHPLGFYDG